MKIFRQLVVACLIALLTIGTMIHAASATTMAAEMTFSDTQLDGSNSCQVCPDDSNASPFCDLICTTTFLTLPTFVEIERALIHALFTRSPDRYTKGEFGAPDPTPPKFII